MTRRTVLCMALLALTAGGQAASLAEYLKLRKRFGISQATTSSALQTVFGSATLEVKAKVKGVFLSGESAGLLLEAAGGEAIFVRSAGFPDWLKQPNVEARMLIQARRANEFSSLEANLLGVIEEPLIAKWEADRRAEQAAAEAKKRAAAKRASSLPAGAQRSRGASAASWNLPPNSALPYYADFIRRYNPRLSAAHATEIAQGIIGFSIQYGVDARLITAMVLVESGFNAAATSRKGAMGLGQLMPGTARGMGVRNAYDTFENLWGTVRLVRGHLEKYSATAANGRKYYDLVLALAAYNAGGGAVRRHGGVPPYRETHNYIQKVIDWYRALAGIR